MSLYIIGDLHLSFTAKKPMDVFGPNWQDHHLRLRAHWEEKITSEDTVVIAGDISWGISLEEAKADLEWLHQLPGKKLLLRGNHDYWWTTLKKMRLLFDSIDYLQNNAYSEHGYTIVGTRGWTVPMGQNPDAQEVKIFERECQRLELSIAAAPKDMEMIAILHFPPFDEKGRKSKLNEIIESHGIKQVYFGHIHSHHHLVRQGWVDGVHYRLISGDYLSFNPHKVISEPNQEDREESHICPNSPFEESSQS